MSEQIKAVEEQLQDVMGVSKSKWTEAYRLMKRVRDESLYVPEFRSFSAWVNDFAGRSKVHVGTMWKYLQAGEFQEEYEARAKKRGIALPENDTPVSADSLQYIAKLAADNPNTEYVDRLVASAQKGELTQAELRNAWAAKRASKEALGMQAVKRSRHDHYAATTTNPLDPMKTTETTETEKLQIPQMQQITAADIVMALQHNDGWFEHYRYDTADSFGNRSKFKRATESKKYRVLTEVAVRTGGDSINSRRIDALVCESKSVRYPSDLVLRAVEIKVSKTDLLGDHKMHEYTVFPDYFYIAVPENLVEDAKSIAAKEWGILSVHDIHTVNLIQPPTRLEGLMRDKLLAQALHNVM